MMKSKLAILAIGFGVLTLTAPVVAHHSVTGEYDADKPVTVKGTVTKVE